MLKFKINNSNANFSYENIETDSMTFFEDANYINVSVKANGHNLMANDAVRLVCIGGDHYYEEVNITVVDDDNFCFDKSQYIDMDILNIEKTYVDYLISDGTLDVSGTTYSVSDISYKETLVINLSSPHYCWVGKKTYAISEILDNNYFENTSTNTIKRCDGDYVFFNGFVYNATVKDGKYNPYGDYKNYSGINIKFQVNGKTYELENGCMPFNEDGTYDASKIYFFYGDDDAVNKKLNIVASSGNISAKYWDTRYFEFPNSGDTLEFAKDYNGDSISMLMKEVGDFHLNFGMLDSFATDIKRDELFHENYLSDVEEKSINKIIDFEKCQFIPMYYSYSGTSIPFNNEFVFDDKNLKPIEKITFNLHFRARSNEYDNNGNILKEWVVTDDKYWNNYEIKSNGEFTLVDKLSSLKNNDKKDQYGDCLAYLNFTDDDVYYQKGKIKKSFIRLSFYDSRDRATQVLQFYSTIFLDSGRLYSNYIRAKNSDIDGDDFVANEQVDGKKVNEDKRLGVSFSVSNKYDMMASSEGFYLYLFPDILKGEKMTPLYMKVEFNHAKYGRIVPFTMPVRNDDIPITDYYHFPIHYLKTSGDTIDGVNVARLMNDTYIKVYTKYDSDKNQFVWFLPRTNDKLNGLNDNSEMIFNLWEPRINGFETLYIPDNGNGGSGGDDDGTITGKGELFNIVVYLDNDLPDGDVMLYSLKLNDQIVCNKELNGGGNSEVITTQLRIPTDSNTVKVGVYFQNIFRCFTCVDNRDTYNAYLYNYFMESVFSDGSDFEGKSFGTCGKEGNVEISHLLLTFKDTQVLRFYMKVY